MVSFIVIASQWVPTNPLTLPKKNEKTLQGIENVEKYIDDIAIFSNDWNEHIRTLNEVFDCLQQSGFSINPKKCEWAVQETDFLGYYLTPNGIKPWSKR